MSEEDDYFAEIESAYDAGRTKWHRRFWESPDGQKIRGYSEGDLDHLCENWEILTAFCASQIEHELACEMFHRFTLIEQYWPFIIRPGEDRYPKMGFSIQPQKRIGPYRADFAISHLVREGDTGSDGCYSMDELPHVYHAQLVVECDGHDFHEKTKEQAARDKRRDRVFLQNGWPVARFTGSEIKNDPGRCAEEVIQILNAMVDAEKDATKEIRAQARARRIARRENWSLK